jgi:anaerobic ribonucleoside-triphosphate reductase activating protein
MSADALYYAGCAYPVQGLGPGKRLGLWLRGCARACPGCMAPELWERSHPAALADVARDLAPWLGVAEGLTISGGEPFDQAEALLELLRLLRQAQPELEVLAYSGYELEELQAAGGAQAALLGELDMLLDGAYREELPGTLIWRGSDNQRLHLLTPRARRHAWAQTAPWPEPRPFAMRMLDSARCLLVGIPRRGDLELLRQHLRARGNGVIPMATEPDA